MCHEKEQQKTSQTDLRIQKVIERRGDELFVKSKGYDNLKIIFWIYNFIMHKITRRLPKLFLPI